MEIQKAQQKLSANPKQVELKQVDPKKNTTFQVTSMSQVDSMISDKFRAALVYKLVREFEYQRKTSISERPALEHEVKALVHEYLVFIWLKMLNPKQAISPPKPIDVVWHRHILFTKEYSEFCQYHLGFFLHHSPTVPNYSDITRKDNIKTYAKVLIRYKHHTKLEPPRQFWPQSDKVQKLLKVLQKHAIIENSRVKFVISEGEKIDIDSHEETKSTTKSEVEVDCTNCTDDDNSGQCGGCGCGCGG